MRSVKVNKKVNRKAPAATGSGVEILLMKCSNLDRRNLQRLCLKINIKRTLMKEVCHLMKEVCFSICFNLTRFSEILKVGVIS